MSKKQQKTEIWASEKVSGRKGNCLRSAEESESRMRVVWHHSAASHLLLLISLHWYRVKKTNSWLMEFFPFFPFWVFLYLCNHGFLTIKNLLLPVTLRNLLPLLDISPQTFVAINTLLVADTRISIVFPEIVTRKYYLKSSERQRKNNILMCVFSPYFLPFHCLPEIMMEHICISKTFVSVSRTLCPWEANC